MTYAYNYNRSFEQRVKRYVELSAKAVVPSEAKYVVVCTRNGADGDFFNGSSYDRHYFTHRATAIAFAQHFSDINENVAGVYKMPEFIRRADVR